MATGQGRSIGGRLSCPAPSANHENPFINCDNRCTEKAVRYWQIASVVVEEGGEAHIDQFMSAVLQRTTQCSKASRGSKFVAMESSGGKESASRDNLKK